MTRPGETEYPIFRVGSWAAFSNTRKCGYPKNRVYGYKHPYHKRKLCHANKQLLNSWFPVLKLDTLSIYTIIIKRVQLNILMWTMAEI